MLNSTNHTTHTVSDFWTAAQAGAVGDMTLIALSQQQPLAAHAIRHLRAKYGIVVTVDLTPESLNPTAVAPERRPVSRAPLPTPADREMAGRRLGSKVIRLPLR